MRWLLMLGAELEYEGSLDDALTHLAGLGVVQPLTDTRITAARDGGTCRYRNRMVQLEHPGPRDALVEELKRLERRLGRGTQPGVPLDIDLLARDEGGGWHADAHAIAKGELDAPHVRMLLSDAGLQGLCAAPGSSARP